MSCGAETEANDLMTALLAGTAFVIPDVDLTQPEYQMPADANLPVPEALTNAALTTGVVGGTGTFDQVMSSVKAHIDEQFELNRFTGDQFAKAYAEITGAALSNAVQFLLGRDQAYWQAIAAQQNAKIAMAQAVTARVNLEIAKAELASKRYEAKTNEAVYALTKMKLSTESMAYCTAKFNLESLAPVQLKLLQEQHENARAQTLDTRSDGVTPVSGSVGKQKELLAQQVTSYKRDAEIKAGKLFTDAWITQKTIDEGLLPPNEFANASLDVILGHIKTNNNLA